MYEQYFRYMWNAAHLDFGIPFQSPTETVTGLIARVWPPTLHLALVVILISYSFGLSLGIIAAMNQNSWIDHLVTALATLGFAVPNFVVAIWFILISSVSSCTGSYRRLGQAREFHYAGDCLFAAAHWDRRPLYPGEHARSAARRITSAPLGPKGCANER